MSQFQCVMIFALSFFALDMCVSNANANANANTKTSENLNTHSIPNSAPQGTNSSAGASEFLTSSRFKREPIYRNGNTAPRRKRLGFNDSDSDSDADHDVVAHVVNGETADRSDPIPYQLSIRYQGNHICGAVILDETTAITAAHCFGETRDVRRYHVVAGENRLDLREEKEQILGVKKIIIHPEYKDFRNGRDLAVLHVERFQFNKYARGAWLSPFSNQELANKKAVISGWGQVSNAHRASNSLQRGYVSILSAKECEQWLNAGGMSVRGIICVLNPQTRTCSGDSGGPLVIQNYRLGDSIGNLLVGIVSFGAADCEIENTASYFTEVSHFYDWIQANRDKRPCEANQSPCVTGGCYNLDWKCDKEEDCSDGTDELNCDGNKRKIDKLPPQYPRLDYNHDDARNTATSCSVAMETSKQQTIHPHGNDKKVNVLCDFDTDGGGWTIIQKRSSGPLHDFDRGWSDYVQGFGSLDGNFWLGLENIYALTKNGDQELRIELGDFEGDKAWAKYSIFYISDASDFYRLSIGGFSGTARDSMTAGEFSNNRRRFSTKDNDNDNSLMHNCAGDLSAGGWWFDKCGNSLLNGLYRRPEQSSNDLRGILWGTWKGQPYSLANTEMKIRKRQVMQQTTDPSSYNLNLFLARLLQG